MPPTSVFIFDSSYPSVDIALPIDDTLPHIIVSDREVEPPPGHNSLKLEEVTGFEPFRRNVRLLRDAWHKASWGKCIVIAAFGMRREQLLLNMLYALLLSRNVLLFDGMVIRPLSRSGAVIFRSVASVLARSTLGRLKAKLRTWQFNRRLKSDPNAATPEGQFFGFYDLKRSFSLPLDPVVQQPRAVSVYGSYTRGWYLPHFSNRSERFVINTTRHRLRNIVLHIEDVAGSAERLLFKDGRMLDYPYLLPRMRRSTRFSVSTRGEVKSIDRGIDLLHYTSGYYHWLIEGVPRILDLIDDGMDFTQYPLLLPTLQPFQRQLLCMLGVCPETQVIEFAKNDWCHVAECIFPTANFPFAARDLEDPSGQPAGSVLHRIRDRILERLPIPSSENAPLPEKIYVSRAKAVRRKLTAQSEEDVRSVLESAGFQTVILECLPWTEQVRLMTGAKFIAGMHGAGLANILLAKGGGALLEFQNSLEARPHFAHMAREIGMDYAYIIGKLDGISPNFDNIVIDPEALTDMLHRFDGAT